MRRYKIQAALLAFVLSAGGAAAQVDTGTANFTRYVALGDSLTAGFASGSIHKSHQINSYPALIFQQATGQTSGFEQPLVSEPGLPGILTLQSLIPRPVIAPTPGQGQPTNLNLQRPYNNMAVPGARLHDLLTKTQSTSATDPTDLILRRLGATQLQQGLSLAPTFVTLWIGNNDALAAATSGIAIVGVTLTPVEQFDAELRAVAGGIASVNARMAIANIPDVTTIPFVTTVSRFVTLPTGQTVTLVGPNGPLQAGDFVLLTASADIANGRGIPGLGPPLGDNQVLSAAEVALIRDHVNHYNATIAAVANERGAALVDSNAALIELATEGVHVGGVTYNSAFLTGGVFSYDGVHPTPFGYAFIANQFIEAINERFEADIPPVNLAPFVFGTQPKSAIAGALPAPDFVLTAAAGKQIVDLFNQKQPKPRRPRRH